jgi:hypothetical protein
MSLRASWSELRTITSTVVTAVNTKDNFALMIMRLVDGRMLMYSARSGLEHCRQLKRTCRNVLCFWRPWILSAAES